MSSQSQPRDWTHVACVACRFFPIRATREGLMYVMPPPFRFTVQFSLWVMSNSFPKPPWWSRSVPSPWQKSNVPPPKKMEETCFDSVIPVSSLLSLEYSWDLGNFCYESDMTERLHFHALEKEMATHCSVLAWRIPGTGKPVGLPSMGSHRVRNDWSDLAEAAIKKIIINVLLFHMSAILKNTISGIIWPLCEFSVYIV